jgi:hypothetical protein
MEMNVEKTKVMTISRQPSTIQIMADQNNRGMWNISNIWVMQDVHRKLYPVLPWQTQHSTKRKILSAEIGLKFEG